MSIAQTLYSFGSHFTTPPIPPTRAEKPEVAEIYPSQSHSTKLDFTLLQFFNEMRKAIPSEKFLQQIGSQGFYESLDKNFAYMHESTTSPLYYRLNYVTITNGINLDRGTFATKSDGTHCGCIADGVSSGGLLSGFAAQQFTNLIVKMLCDRTSEDLDELSRAKMLFTACATAAKSTKEYGGSATVAFVDSFEADTDDYLARFGAIGDAAVFHVKSDSYAVEQKNRITREVATNVSDTGGQISIDGFIESPENISAGFFRVDKRDLCILATDGLTDNINHNQLHAIMSFIIQNPRFDEDPKELCKVQAPWEKEHPGLLPTLEELQSAFPIPKEIAQKPLTASQIVTRLTSYCKLVTHTLCRFEEERFEILLNPHMESSAKIAIQELQEEINNSPYAAVDFSNNLFNS
jgi:hypothetical protein